MMKPASKTRHGVRGKFPPRKNGCFGGKNVRRTESVKSPKNLV